MITVLRASGLRIVIYRHDHEPPHVHVLGDGEVRILLFGAGGLPELVEITRMKPGDVRKALRAVRENHQLLLEEWRRIHG